MLHCVVQVAPFEHEERLGLDEERMDERAGGVVEVGDLTHGRAPLDGHHGLAVVEIELLNALACISTAKVGLLVSRIKWRYHFMKRGDYTSVGKSRGGTGRIRQVEERGEQEYD